jgi:hypothetical protein
MLISYRVFIFPIDPYSWLLIAPVRPKISWQPDCSSMIGKRAKALSPDNIEDLLVFASTDPTSHPQPGALIARFCFSGGSPVCPMPGIR